MTWTFLSAQAKRYGTFLIYQGTSLTGLNLRTTTGINLLVSLMLCADDDRCYSFNYYVDDMICETGTRYQSTIVEGLQDRIGLSHYSHFELSLVLVLDKNHSNKACFDFQQSLLA